MASVHVVLSANVVKTMPGQVVLELPDLPINVLDGAKLGSLDETSRFLIMDALERLTPKIALLQSIVNK